MIWQCPICKCSIVLKDKQCVCSNGHSFDLAKQGYVNLLPANFKQSKNPGDSQLMIKARKAFLAAGCYEPLLNFLLKWQQEYVSTVDGGPQYCLDLGGGEGYFSSHLQEGTEGSCHWFLSDISKDAVKSAAKRFHRGHCAVASSFNLPVKDECLDVVLRNFAPSDDHELHRVMKPGAHYVLVSPGPSHLVQLREILYQSARPHEPAPLPDWAEPVAEQTQEFEFSLADPPMRENLLAMTPLYWHASEAARQQWLLSSDTAITASFRIAIGRKPHA